MRTRRHLRITARDLVGRHDALFEHAPPDGILARFGLSTARHYAVETRALFVAALCWLPIVGLSALLPESGVLPRSGMHLRYLVAAPLLVLAAQACGSRLTTLAHHFVIGNLIADTDRDRFDRIIASTRTLLTSGVVELVAWVVAYGIVATVLAGPAWRHWSPAMWWNALVSLPLVLVLIFGWFWRIVLWARLLFLVSRLGLRLVASHPDRAAGLGFLGDSLRAFAIVAFAVGVMLAGASARLVIDTRAVPTSQVQADVAILGAAIALMIAPLAALSPTLARTYRRGVTEYGELAAETGRAFEGRWLATHAAKTPEAGLHEPDFSATIDLYSVVANVHAMRLLPMAFKDVAVLLAGAVLPFLPILFATVPADVLWTRVRDLLL